MTITDLVAPEAILPALKVISKKQALQELSARAAVLTGQNERSTPVVMQNAGERISVVWPTNIRTQEPVFPLPKSSIYAM